MNPAEYIHDRIPHCHPAVSEASAFAPSNIALVKYWGKRNIPLNLPVNDSLSISLGALGAKTALRIATDQDYFFYNQAQMPEGSPFSKRLSTFLDYFRTPDCPYFTVDTQMNIPMAAGLASSACGFAALVEGLNQLFNWQLDKPSLSQLSRIGSGSASRSHWQGLVQWSKGACENGSDCIASPIETPWNALRLVVLPNSSEPKMIGSRQAMLNCQTTSPGFTDWPALTESIFTQVVKAVQDKDFDRIGSLAQKHAIAMHDLIKTSKPSFNYDTPKSIAQKDKLHTLQQDGVACYYTQDAGPHIKVLVLEPTVKSIQTIWPKSIVVNPWSSHHE